MRRRRAMTLPEVLVGAGVLALLLGVSSAVLTSYARAYRELDGALPSLRTAAHTTEATARTLASTRAVLSPGRDVLERGYAPVWGRTEPLVVSLLQPDGRTQLAAFAFDPEQGRLLRVDYDRQLEPQRHWLGECRGWWVRLEYRRRVPLLRLRLEPVPVRRLGFQTTVRLGSDLRWEAE